ncbi:MAG: S1/P1 Nuclease [Chitinophagaceae bacterium]|nr:MAG: S1/P1 Nuclease [Chitinophagaceae bacterium]
MRRWILLLCLIFSGSNAWCWGFFGHRHINYHAVFLLPPEMLVFYKPNIEYLTEHAVDPDKRRYAVNAEAPRHYIDLDRYGDAPWNGIPRKWADAVEKYGEDTLNSHGIGPWWLQVMLARLTISFRAGDKAKILKLSAELGHYIADLHVPLHASSNHNGQHTNQHGIHGFWESRVPELLAEKQWDFYIGHAGYIQDPLKFTWDRVIESGLAADTVLRFEKMLSDGFATDRKFAYEDRNGIIIRQYSRSYSLAYNDVLNNMIERRMRMSIYAVASLWYTAWANAGQPDLKKLQGKPITEEDEQEFAELNLNWKDGKIKGKSCD